MPDALIAIPETLTRRETCSERISLRLNVLASQSNSTCADSCDSSESTVWTSSLATSVTASSSYIVFARVETMYKPLEDNLQGEK